MFPFNPVRQTSEEAFTFPLHHTTFSATQKATIFIFHRCITSPFTRGGDFLSLEDWHRPCVWKPDNNNRMLSNNLITMHTDSFCVQKNVVFPTLSGQSCLRAKWDYWMVWKKRGSRSPIAPLCFRWCSTAIASAAAAAADTYGFQGGKQILVDRKSGPTLINLKILKRVWKGVSLQRFVVCLETIFSFRLHKRKVERSVKKKCLFWDGELEICWLKAGPYLFVFQSN